MTNYQVKDLADNSLFTKPVFLDGDFILASPETPLDGKLKAALLRWRFQEIQSEGLPVEKQTPAGKPGDNPPERAPPEEDDAVEPAGDRGILSSREWLREARDYYTAFQSYAESLYNQMSRGESPKLRTVAEQVAGLCNVIRKERRFLLRVIQTVDTGGGNYLAAHGAKSCILSIIIGLFLKLPGPQLIELGMAALLHEAGMARLPPQITGQNRPLTQQEQQLVLNHPIEGYQLLQSFKTPQNISLPALEHHERINGEGYPRKLREDQISRYGKIIAVACSYEAMSAPRPFRDAKDGYTNMLELLKNERKGYDETIIRALVLSLSIYPVGLYVLLSNGQKAQVVDVNPAAPRYPVVQVLGNDGGNQPLETSATGISIVRSLKRDEVLS
ncbi:MAG: HD-GYP domain-containing protein [Treponema sp.]|jgi:HD-GYP domain-containing protein (c-di-GMP phosphodiesterase class II)|nr:HD-GYP domain-containing protein [Treponema sp.]